MTLRELAWMLVQCAVAVAATITSLVALEECVDARRIESLEMIMDDMGEP